MIRAAIIFFLIAILAFVFGAYGIAGISIEIGKILLGVFIAFAILSFVIGFARGDRLYSSHRK
jgi:uncharacterized membrane protein YtjA (UPF0391 family)